MSKPVLYLDMDGVLVDFPGTLNQTPIKLREHCMNWCIETGMHHSDFPGIFGNLEPLQNAVQSVKDLCTDFEVYLLSSPPWNNLTAWTDKRKWVDKHLPFLSSKHLILSHRKDLNRGRILVDDRPRHGAYEFGLFPGQTWLKFDDESSWPEFVERIRLEIMEGGP